MQPSNSHYKDRKYSVIPYDPNWPKEFDKQASLLKNIFGSDAITIEHIGSTAVPGMDGKPTIDILVLVNDLSVAENHIIEMKTLDYDYAGEYVMKGSRLFHLMKDNTLISNVHIFPTDHPHVQEMIGLRDYLRSHPEEVQKYTNVKKELFEKYPNDYAAYRKYKDEFMNEMKKRANITTSN